MLPQFSYLVPALYVNLTAHTSVSLGNLSTGSQLVWGNLINGNIYSEDGFEPCFNGTALQGTDLPTLDPKDGLTRTDVQVIFQPDGDETPFEMLGRGILKPDSNFETIISTGGGEPKAYGAGNSVWFISFRGGSSKFAGLQNSIFIASQTIAPSVDGGKDYRIGFKISQVMSTQTNITIGEEYEGA